MVLLDVSFMKFILRNSKEIKLEGESDVNRSIIDELQSSDILGDQMEGESGVTRSVFEEVCRLDIQGD